MADIERGQRVPQENPVSWTIGENDLAEQDRDKHTLIESRIAEVDKDNIAMYGEPTDKPYIKQQEEELKRFKSDP